MPRGGLIAIISLLLFQMSASQSESISFFSKLEARIKEVDSHLCVGLDPHINELFPNGDGYDKSEEERCDAAFTFCKTLIDATGMNLFSEPFLPL